MEPTVSDPSVVTQMGMRVGMPDAGQINALETLNIRGERSVTCKGAFDAHPSTGPLPRRRAGGLRRIPQAARRARARRRARRAVRPQSRSRPRMPMYCVVAAFKDPYDTKDMRTTSNNDVNFAMDVPPFDSTIVAQLRDERRDHLREVGRARVQRRPRQSRRRRRSRASTGRRRPADQRVERPGVQPVRHRARRARLERRLRRRDRRQSRDDRHLRAIGRVVPGPGIAQRHRADPDDEGPHARQRRHRQSVVQRSRRHSCAHAAPTRRCVLDAIEGSRRRATTTRAIRSRRCRRRWFPSSRTRASPSATRPAASRSRSHGMRVAILREHMVKQTPNHEAISDQIDREIKTVLRDQLGAELVETTHAGVPGRSARAEPRITRSPTRCRSSCRGLMPEVFSRRNDEGRAVLRRAGLRRHVVRLSAEAEQARGAADARRSTSRTSTRSRPCRATRALQRHRVRSSTAISPRAATRGSRIGRPGSRTRSSARTRRAPAPRTGWRSTDHTIVGKADRLARSYVARMALLKVMYENDIDVFVHPENTVPTPKIQGPNVGTQQPRRHHAVLPDPAHRRAGRRHATSSTSRSTR